MSKRQSGPRFSQADKNKVPTPRHAVFPLLTGLPETGIYVEPCGGDGQLVKHLAELAPGLHCHMACGMEPRADWIEQRDCTTLTSAELANIDLAITNVPFEWALAEPIMKAVITWPLTTWFLAPSDWITHQRFKPYAAHIWQMAPIGRVRWKAGTKHKSTEAFSWYRLESTPLAHANARPTTFFTTTE